MKNLSILKVRLLIFIAHAASACFYPFLPVYFNNRNLTYTQIGLTFGVTAVIGMALQPFWGYISDKFLNKKVTLLILMTFSSFIMILFTIADSFPEVIVLIALSALSMCGIAPLMDAYIFDFIEGKKNLNFSQFRIMASAAYAVINLVMGFVIKRTGIDITFIISIILMLSAIFLLWNMNFEEKKIDREFHFDDVKALVKDKSLILYFISIFLMNIAIAGGSNFMNELIKFTKGDVSNLGMVWFVTAFVEVFIFSLSGKMMKKLGVVRLYWVALGIYAVKYALNFLLDNPLYIISVQFLEGVSFTLFLLASLEYLNKRISSNLRATGISICSAIGGLGSFTSSILSGLLLNKINPPQLFGLFALVSLAALIVSLGFREKQKSLTHS